MNKYQINYTDTTDAQKVENPIEVPEAGMNSDFSVSFPGRVRLEWGGEINDAFLNLLENFSCPENSIGFPKIPDDSADTNGKLSNPVQGQLWYNSTDNRLYNYSGDRWEPYVISSNNYGANWGQVNSGELIPRPVAPDGYVFPYSECIWSVSPFNYLERFDRMTCETDPVTSLVTMTYRSSASSTEISGIANYLIIGIRRNINNFADAECP